MPLFRALAKNMAPMTNADESPTNRLTLFCLNISLFIVSTLWPYAFSYLPVSIYSIYSLIGLRKNAWNVFQTVISLSHANSVLTTQNIFQKFLRGVIKKEKTIQSKDGRLKIQKTSRAAKKPGQRNRVKSTRTQKRWNIV